MKRLRDNWVSQTLRLQKSLSHYGLHIATYILKRTSISTTMVTQKQYAVLTMPASARKVRWIVNNIKKCLFVLALIKKAMPVTPKL